MRKIIFLFGIICLVSCQQGVRVDMVFTQSFSEQWLFRAGTGAGRHYEHPNINDSTWTVVSGNQTLQEQGQTLENGFGWYRKTFFLSDSMQMAIKAADAAILHLGRLGAADKVFLNGRMAGKTGDFPDNYMAYHNEERNYVVPAEYFNPTGKNVIAIQFFDGKSIGGFLDDTPFTISSALTTDKMLMAVRVMSDNFIFTNENPSLRVAIANRNKWPIQGYVTVNLTTDDSKKTVQRDSVLVALNPNQKAVIPFTIKKIKPGFFRYTVSFYEGNNNLAVVRKLNIGYEPEKIISPVDTLVGFNAFWANNLKELAQIAPEYQLTQIPEFSEGDYTIYKVEMRSLGNELISGYYSAPKEPGKYPVIVEYMGYGSKPYPPTQVFDGFSYFILSIRGQGLNEPDNRFGEWITYGLKDKNRYYYRGAYCDAVRAIDFVCSRAATDTSKIVVRGGSQGGALSFVAAALDKRVKAAAPSIPFLSDFRDYFVIAPWTRGEMEKYLEQQPEVSWNNIYDVLSYFDIKNLAPRIKCPLLMGMGVQDEVCPPHINFAAYNQVVSEKEWIAYPENGHSVGKDFYEKQILFFKQHLKIED